MVRATPAKAMLLAATAAWLAGAGLAPARGDDDAAPRSSVPARLTELAAPVLELRAQPVQAPAVLPWPEVAGRLARRGYVVAEPASLRGPTYLATSTDRRGRRLRLVVDGRNAEIIGIRVMDGATAGDRPAAFPAPPPPQ
ncbi:hypothetical protein [Phreatobacter sp. AB_2022a]|uniref:hypothetical protein n=1 Tax=Phreatobacter sp. AB_2022a TaxID=3003134 RepID=UPI002286E688|nr:hypothetical protein [Phreatobacter sp. AB_2022a]MCZ0738603.1 hypothetical protein [Phreatobacter sp. AB_2022a]